VQFVGPPNQQVQRVGILCGSGGELLPDAIRQGCDVFLTGEARFHTCLEAEAHGIGLVLAGHYATERPGMEHMAAVLGKQFPKVDFQASQMEVDPLKMAE
jgi:putative NIF3 family GTP cyclohydrolase 1 type 2